VTGSKKRAQWKAYKNRQAEHFKKLIGLGCDPALKKILYLLKDMLLIIPTEQLIKGLASPVSIYMILTTSIAFLNGFILGIVFSVFIVSSVIFYLLCLPLVCKNLVHTYAPSFDPLFCTYYYLSLFLSALLFCVSPIIWLYHKCKVGKIGLQAITLSPSCKAAFCLANHFLSCSKFNMPPAVDYWQVHFKQKCSSAPKLKNARALEKQLLLDLDLLSQTINADTIIYGYTPRNLKPLIQRLSNKTETKNYKLFLAKSTIPAKMAKLYRKKPRKWDYIVLFIQVPNMS